MLWLSIMFQVIIYIKSVINLIQTPQGYSILYNGGPLLVL